MNCDNYIYIVIWILLCSYIKTSIGLDIYNNAGYFVYKCVQFKSVGLHGYFRFKNRPKLRDVWWDQPISHSLLHASLFSLILPFQIDIRTRKYILHRGKRRDGLISVLVTTSSPRLKARAWCGDLCWDQPISPSQQCSIYFLVQISIWNGKFKLISEACRREFEMGWSHLTSRSESQQHECEKVLSSIGLLSFLTCRGWQDNA